VKSQSIADVLGSNRDIAVLRAPDATHYLPVLEALVAGGVGALELTLTTPGTIAELPRIIEALGDGAVVGVGTVLTPGDAAAALDAGARFIVSPNTDVDVISAVVQRGGVMLPGAMTPTEVRAAIAAGAGAVKLFPAQTLGVGYLGHLRGPFPNLAAVPSGGVDVAAAVEWAKAGAVAVSVGGPLLGDALRGGDLGALTKRAHELSSVVRDAAA
jgi:2-dehydro-3-deoxyphosphogluconate aldolase/(4S)-4-hydroxy-2-oxoglutarate aldolase